MRALRPSNADSPVSSRDAPRVGVIAGWCDPEDPNVWAGVPRSFIGELKKQVTYIGLHDATPFIPPALLIHKLRGRARLLERSNWVACPEMRALAVLSEPWRRKQTPSDVQAWVHFCGAYGRVARGRYVTISEMRPGCDEFRRWAPSFGRPNSTPGQLLWEDGKHGQAHRHAHACCVPSRWHADALVKKGIPASKVHIIGYGANLTLTPPATRDWAIPRFLFVGRDWNRKNGNGVIRAFQRLRQEAPEARLDVVGNHPVLDVKGVRGHGPLSPFDSSTRPLLEHLYEMATCLVVPSHIEPFGIVYVEAATAGIPSIATTVGGTTESVGDGGIRVRPDDDVALLGAMREMLDAETARNFGAIALSRSSNFTWAKATERLLRAMDLDWPDTPDLAEFL